MQDKMVSIILPVYNGERFLSLCLDSILRQSYSKWELIAVDDGSVDNSLKILQSYASKDRRIRVISKQNEGVSIARNIALEHAQGEYAYFVDSDDIVLPDALSILVSEIESCQATFVKSDFLPIDENGNQVFVNKKQVIRRSYDGKVMNSEKFYRKILMKEFFLWTCLFRRDIIKTNNIRFIPHCRLMEDAAFIVNYLDSSERNVYKDACVYGYRKYEGTASAVKKDYTTDLLLIQKHLGKVKAKTHADLSKIIKNKMNVGTSMASALANKINGFIERMKVAFLYYLNH